MKKGPLPEKNVAGPVLNASFDNTIDTIDAQKAVYATNFEVIGNIMDGLMQMADDGSVQKAICESEEVSPDGLIYTFKLRKDAYWSNGVPVTAHDFVYGWERAVSPATESEYAFMISDIAQIKNSRAVQSGQMEPDQLGVKALDNYTLQVELEVPVSYFDQLLYFCTFYPANKDFIEKCGDSYATSPETFLCNGAFVLTEYKEKATSITLTKNTAYYNANKIRLAGIHYDIIKDGEEGLRKYNANQLDIVELDGSQVAQAKSSPDFRSVPSGFLFYISFNLHDENFANENLRKAVNFGFDREVIAESIADGSVAAWTAVPEGFAFNSKGEDFTKKGIELPELCRYDVSLARDYFEKAKQELGKRSFNIEYLVADVEAQRIAAESMKEQLERNLPGLHLTLRKVPRSERRKIMTRGEYQMGLTNWGPDYADPMTYLAMWMTGNDNNTGDYRDPHYDAIIASCTDGDLCTKVDERWAALKEAEKMVMGNAIVSPVYQQCNADLIKPNVKGIAFHAVAINRIYKNTTK